MPGPLSPWHVLAPRLDEYRAPSASVAMALRECNETLAAPVAVGSRAPWDPATTPVWIRLQRAVDEYAKRSEQNGLAPERVVDQLTRILEQLALQDPDREPRLRAALITFFLASHFGKCDGSQPTTETAPTLVGFCYGHRCVSCDRFMPRLADDQRGVGRPVRIVNDENPVETIRCDSCGHASFYWASSMVRMEV